MSEAILGKPVEVLRKPFKKILKKSQTKVLVEDFLKKPLEKLLEIPLKKFSGKFPEQFLKGFHGEIIKRTTEEKTSIFQAFF